MHLRVSRRHATGPKLVRVILGLASVWAPAADAGAATFSAEQVRADAAFLYETLQASHFDLFTHTPKDAYDHAFARLHADLAGERRKRGQTAETGSGFAV